MELDRLRGQRSVTSAKRGTDITKTVWQSWWLTSLLGLKLQLPCRPLLDWMEVKLRRGTGLTRVSSASLKVQGRPRYSPQLPGSVVLQAGHAVSTPNW